MGGILILIAEYQLSSAAPTDCSSAQGTVLKLFHGVCSRLTMLVGFLVACVGLVHVPIYGQPEHAVGIFSSVQENVHSTIAILLFIYPFLDGFRLKNMHVYYPSDSISLPEWYARSVLACVGGLCLLGFS